VEPLNRAKTATDETEGRLIELLSAAVPTALPDSQKHRSLQAILAPNREYASRRFTLARPALIFGVLFLVTGVSAAATIGASWIKRRSAVGGSAVDRAPVPQLVTPPPPVRVHSAPVAAPPPAVPVIEEQAVELPRLGAPAPGPSHSRTARGENPSALMEAVKALRQEHDPVRASRLLREYLRLYPRGALSEEARALAIEAARTQHSPNTVSLADEYLRLYPHGRFRRAAEQAAGRTDP
jgi:hypothetical protein